MLKLIDVIRNLYHKLFVAYRIIKAEKLVLAILPTKGATSFMKL